MKKPNPLITPGVHLPGLLDIEGMCWNINSDRYTAIRAFKQAVFLALPDDQAARDGHFNAAALRIAGYNYFSCADLLKFDGVDLSAGTLEANTVAIAVNAIEHGVPVATINFLAAIHLSPSLPKE
jgi:hypothetical protein